LAIGNGDLALKFGGGNLRLLRGGEKTSCTATENSVMLRGAVYKKKDKENQPQTQGIGRGKGEIFSAGVVKGIAESARARSALG